MNERRLRKKLKRARWWLEREPNNVTYIETMARLLRWLGEMGATDLFRRAAENRLRIVHRTSRKRLVQNPKILFTVGNYYRLAGDEEETRRYLEWAYSELQNSVPGALSTSQDLARFIECGYLLGRYKEIEAVDREKGSHRLLGELSRIRLAGDARAAKTLAEEVARGIRESRQGPGSAGLPLSAWDSYELALQAVEDLGGVSEFENERALETSEAETLTKHETPKRRKFTREEVVKIFEDAVETGEEVNLADTDLAGVDLSELQAWQVLFADADLSGANLSGSDFREARFSGALMRGVDLSQAWLKEANLSGADLSNANLRRVDLVLATLIKTNLENADLSEAELRNTNFQEANLRGTDLRGAELQEPDFSYADLSKADLSSLDLGGADLVRAKLRGANLSGADLSYTDLTEADLTGADLRRANLESADLENAIMDDALT